MNNWLLGWHDPVNAYLATGDTENKTAGWTSLEANETFFGSAEFVEGGISTGEPVRSQFVPAKWILVTKVKPFKSETVNT